MLTNSIGENTIAVLGDSTDLAQHSLKIGEQCEEGNVCRKHDMQWRIYRGDGQLALVGVAPRNELPVVGDTYA